MRDSSTRARMDAKRVRRSRVASFASPPPGARRALAFPSETARETEGDAARASLAVGGLRARARVHAVRHADGERGRDDDDDEDDEDDEGWWIFRFGDVERVRRVDGDADVETKDERWVEAKAKAEGAFATPFARALAEASVTERNVGMEAAAAREPPRRARPMASPTPMKTTKTPPAPRKNYRRRRT